MEQISDSSGGLVELVEEPSVQSNDAALVAAKALGFQGFDASKVAPHDVQTHAAVRLRGKLRAKELAELRRLVEGDDRFARLLDRHCKAVHELILLGNPTPVLAVLAGLVWSSLCIAWELDTSHMPKARMKTELDQLKVKLQKVLDDFSDSRARFLKEIVGHRDKLRRFESFSVQEVERLVYEEEPVMFYEPIRYLDEKTKCHVAQIIEEKLKLLLKRLELGDTPADWNTFLTSTGEEELGSPPSPARGPRGRAKTESGKDEMGFSASKEQAMRRELERAGIEELRKAQGLFNAQLEELRTAKRTLEGEMSQRLEESEARHAKTQMLASEYKAKHLEAQAELSSISAYMQKEFQELAQLPGGPQVPELPTEAPGLMLQQLLRMEGEVRAALGARLKEAELKTRSGSSEAGARDDEVRLAQGSAPGAVRPGREVAVDAATMTSRPASKEAPASRPGSKEAPRAAVETAAPERKASGTEGATAAGKRAGSEATPSLAPAAALASRGGSKASTGDGVEGARRTEQNSAAAPVPATAAKAEAKAASRGPASKTAKDPGSLPAHASSAEAPADQAAAQAPAPAAIERKESVEVQDPCRKCRTSMVVGSHFCHACGQTAEEVIDTAAEKGDGPAKAAAAGSGDEKKRSEEVAKLGDENRQLRGEVQRLHQALTDVSAHVRQLQSGTGPGLRPGSGDRAGKWKIPSFQANKVHNRLYLEFYERQDRKRALQESVQQARESEVLDIFRSQHPWLNALSKHGDAASFILPFAEGPSTEEDKTVEASELWRTSAEVESAWHERLENRFTRNASPQRLPPSPRSPVSAETEADSQFGGPFSPRRLATNYFPLVISSYGGDAKSEEAGILEAERRSPSSGTRLGPGGQMPRPKSSSALCRSKASRKQLPDSGALDSKKMREGFRLLSSKPGEASAARSRSATALMRPRSVGPARCLL